MFFDSFSAFIEMGGHGFYVWLSFGLTGLLIIGNIAHVHVARRNFFREYTQRKVRLSRKSVAPANPDNRSQQEKA
jgi:heme exporter protein D